MENGVQKTNIQIYIVHTYNILYSKICCTYMIFKKKQSNIFRNKILRCAYTNLVNSMRIHIYTNYNIMCINMIL